MPMGKGTYGSKVGRPKKKAGKKMTSAMKSKMAKMRKMKMKKKT